MTLICYRLKRFGTAARAMIAKVNEIITDYGEQGYTLALRQLFYQLVVKNLIANTEKEYAKLGSLITDARMSGVISWSAIEDRGRENQSWLINENPRDALFGIETNFALDMWDRQGIYIELFVEKDALSGIVQVPCNKWRVPFTACKGYLSASTAWAAGQRYKKAADAGKNLVALHLGDHDPSGLDMSRDLRERLQLFGGGCEIDFVRLGLNMNQVREFRPPPNPTKITDNRAAKYIKEFGHSSWELDALRPEIIAGLIETEVAILVDDSIWQRTLDDEAEIQSRLHRLYAEYDAIVAPELGL